MASYTLRIDQGKLKGVGMRRAKSLVTRFTRRTFNYSQTRVPVDNGVLRASGAIIPASANGAMVESAIIYTAEYAAAVHNGRRSLTIFAKTRADGRPGLLRFTVNGRVVYAKWVHQKARPPRPYLYNALLKAKASAADFEVRTGVFLG